MRHGAKPSCPVDIIILFLFEVLATKKGGIINRKEVVRINQCFLKKIAPNTGKIGFTFLDELKSVCYDYNRKGRTFLISLTGGK